MVSVNLAILKYFHERLELNLGRWVTSTNATSVLRLSLLQSLSLYFFPASRLIFNDKHVSAMARVYVVMKWLYYQMCRTILFAQNFNSAKNHSEKINRMLFEQSSRLTEMQIEGECKYS